MVAQAVETAASAESDPAGATIARDERADDDFARVPHIGPLLADRIHSALHIESYEDLEAAAVDGRLATVAGIGAARVQAIRAYLDAFLGAHHPAPRPDAARPSVALVLDVDADYRRLAEAGCLARVAPRRLNPTHRAWLPVWHTRRDGWSLTAMYSNTARAHELGKTRDWVVVVYAREDGAGEEEGEETVVTEYRGPHAGQRTVRGREAECEALYDERGVDPDVRAWAHALADAL